MRRIHVNALRWLTRPLSLALLLAVAAFALMATPARAQTPGPPASVVISETTGALVLGSYFILTATITDSNGALVADGTRVVWYSGTVPGGRTVRAPRQWSLSTAGVGSTLNGQARMLYRAAVAGSVSIGVDAGVSPNEVSIDHPVEVAPGGSERPPEPWRIALVAPAKDRRAPDTADQFTVQAAVTDRDGAPIPDGTPISWSAERVIGASAALSVISQDREVINGLAQTTYRMIAASTTGLLTTVTVGELVATFYFTAPLSALTTPTPEPLVTISDDLGGAVLGIGERVTITAMLTDANGEPVPDGTRVHWAFSGVRDDPGGFIQPSGPVTRESRTTNGRAVAVEYGRRNGLSHIFAYSPGRDNRAWVSFRVGRYPDPPDDVALSLRLIGDADRVVPIGSTMRVGATLSYTGEAEWLWTTGGTLRISGPLQWESSGRNQLTTPGGTIQPFSRSAPDTCEDAAPDAHTDWRCTVDLGESTIHIPAGAKPGDHTVSGVFTVNGREYETAPLEVRVVEPGTVDELAEVRFDFAEQVYRSAPYPSAIAEGERTRLRLELLNENGKVSAASPVSSIVFTTTTGKLSTDINGGCPGGGGVSCQIQVASLSGDETDRIELIVSHPGQGRSGVGEIHATVVAGDGEAFEPPPIRVAFTGPPASLALSEPTRDLLNRGTPDSGPEQDDRDLLKLSLTALDDAGQLVDIPITGDPDRTVRHTIKDPNGRVVQSGIELVDLAVNSSAEPTQLDLSLDVGAGAGQPLATGEYKLEVRIRALKATQTFAVIGGPASLALGQPEAVDGQLTLTARIVDADGNSVSDGTPVAWEEGNTVGRAVLVQAAAQSETIGGQASATYIVVGAGDAWVRATADAVSDVRLLSGLGEPPPPANPAESLSTRAPDRLSAWLGAGTTTASALLAGLEGVSAVRLWQVTGWEHYGLSEGELEDGSVDFSIAPGDILWLRE